MKAYFPSTKIRVPQYFLAALWLLSFCVPVTATVLDGFPSSTRTGWTDTANGGSFFTATDAFTMTTANPNDSLTYSIKTSQSFSNVANHTLEFRVDVKSARPANGDSNAMAILAWVPVGQAVLNEGYSLSVGANDVRIQRGGTLLYSTSTTLQNTNITLVLRMTPSGTDVILTASVYRRAGGTGSLLFEQTVTNSSGIISTSGHAALGVLNQASASGATIVFDDLQVFDLTNTVLDDFNRADTTRLQGLGPAWVTLAQSQSLQTPDIEIITNNMAELNSSTNVASIAAFAVYVAKTFKISDGSRLEFSVDIATNGNGDGAYAVLAYLPALDPSYLQNLRGYHISNISGPYDDTLFVGKEYNRWWASVDDATVDYPVSNYRLFQRYSGEGTSIRIENRLEDLNVDINDPGRVRFQNVFVDTKGPDATGPNTDGFLGGAAYTNVNGFFQLEVFNSGTPLGADVFFDNARVSFSPAPNGPPFFTGVFPGDAANFLAATNDVSFHVVDDTNTPIDNIVLTLNGIRYTNGHPNVVITPSGATATDRLFRLTNALLPNVNYVGSIQAMDNVGAASVAFPLRFDTFLTNDTVIETEEYNFSGGSFIDNPKLIVEGVTDASAYNGQIGTAEVDFHDNRGGVDGGADVHTFRTGDPVRTSHTSDPARSKYVNAGGQAAGYFEQMVGDIHDGDWMNYTHTYPAGTYNVVMRQSLFQLTLPQTLVTLERVTGDRTQPDQTTAILGAFIGSESGFGFFRNVPLTDGVGNPAVVRFSGALDTLRIMNRITGNADDNVGILLQNYFVLVPTEDPGTLRPFLGLVSPLPGSTINSVAPVTTATIVNRDTTVNNQSIILQINGSTVQATVTPTLTGADVAYALSPLPPPDSTLTNTLIFSDGTGFYQTNSWTWSLSYALLRASNSLPVGALSARGWYVRMVDINGATGPGLGNNLARAYQQLALPPAIPFDTSHTGLVQVLNWRDDPSVGLAGFFPDESTVPGLDAGSWYNEAVEAIAYLELTAGLHRFGAVSDDGFGVTSGSSLRDSAGATLASFGCCPTTTFDFVVEATGLYPVRVVWYNNGPPGQFELFSVDLNDANARVLINDTNNPAGVIKAYDPNAVPPVILQSSTTVGGTYTTDPSAIIDTNAKTVTVTASESTRFYRLGSTSALTITTITKNGTTILLKYQ